MDRIEAGQWADMGVDISSVINSVLKSEGDTLERGEVLATLDTERLIAKQRELAKSSLLRAQSLKASRNISDQALKNLCNA